MHDFRYVKGRLHCEGVSIDSLIKKHGTPLYVYSSSTLTDHFQKLDTALAPLDRLVCFAMKSNSNQPEKDAPLFRQETKQTITSKCV